MDDDRRHDPTSRLLADFVQQVGDQVVTPPFTPGRGRARRRDRPHRTHHRRVLALCVSVVLVVGAVALLVAYGPRSSDTGGGVTGGGVAGQPGVPVHAKHVRVRALEFGGTFHPAEIVGAHGVLWMTARHGNDPSTAPCAIERIDPARLSPVAYPLSACGMNIVAGNGALYLETEASQPGSNSVDIGIESFSTTTERSTFLSRHLMTVVGSEIAHTQLAYADGWLWLYGDTDHDVVLQISPTSGAVVRTLTGVPAIGGTEPLVAAGPGGIWLAGGPGGPPAPAVVASDPSTGNTIQALPGTTSATVEWLAPVNARMWKGEANVPQGQHRSLTERIVVVNGSGAFVKRSPVEGFGSAPVAVAGQLWTAGPGGSGCARQPIWRVDPTTLRTTVIATLRPTSDPCLTPSFRSVAGTGGALFVLDGAGGSAPAVLYRVKP
ncbi:MAG TPA: hypothetical protein VNC61_06470 [Acidimicrobiales bacterium]|nr:hypothetical protein [Acidimicrobiales bacterium]